MTIDEEPRKISWKSFYIFSPRKKIVINEVKDEPKTRSICWKISVAITFGLFFSSLILFSVACFYDIDEHFNSKIVNLIEGGIVYEFWSNPPVPNIVSVYPFNYTNVKAFIEGKELLNVQEIGPYVFWEKTQRENIKLSDGHLTYQIRRTLEFNPQGSKGSLDDVIFAPNLPVIIANSRKESSFFEFSALSMLNTFVSPKSLLEITVKDFTEGYGDLVSDFLLTLNGDAKQFGVLAQRSGLSPSLQTIGNGVGEGGNLARVSHHSGRTRMGAYDSFDCDRVDGHEGSIYHRSVVGPDKRIYIFDKEICRKMPLDFQKDIITSDGLPAYRYEVPSNVFASPVNNPENECYCSSNCPPDGVFSLAACLKGAPVVLSFPHFTFAADESLTQKITGLKPDPSKYKCQLDVHPWLGLPLGGFSMLQIGVLVEDATYVPQLRRLPPRTVLPVAWLSVKMGPITEDLVQLINRLMFSKEVLIMTSKYGSLAILIISSFCIFKLLHK